MNSSTARRLILLYHFFHPDDVISARLFTEIGEVAAKQGWQVIAMPSVRSCHDGAARLPARESSNGIDIRRVWRPAWRQSSNRGRLGNTLFMLFFWAWRALTTGRHPNECVVIGTDPPLGILAAIPWRLFRPRCRIVHWCHDLYPQAAVAEGMFQPNSMIVRGLNTLLRIAYRRCDVVADLGPCMRDLIDSAIQGSTAQRETRSGRFPHLITLTPWSLVEPGSILESEPDTRRELFGDATLGLLYSGNLGRAHQFRPFLDLARQLNGKSVGFCYAGRGPRMDELQQSISSEDTNIRFAGFASEEQLTVRLSAADVHMVSLQPNWAGAVVPSKFFGALAVGRPVLYAGSSDSAIAKWIFEHQVGWVLDDPASIPAVADQLKNLSIDPNRLAKLRKHCFEVYHREFSKAVQMERWLRVL
jgi:colanic acid biosynthesis glycosyl transferase WcaI